MKLRVAKKVMSVSIEGFLFDRDGYAFGERRDVKSPYRVNTMRCAVKRFHKWHKRDTWFNPKVKWFNVKSKNRPHHNGVVI